MTRVVRLKDYQLEKRSSSKIVNELMRIGRDREQVRHGSGKNFKYVVIVEKNSETSFTGYIAGPDSDRTRKTGMLNIKFTTSQDNHGDVQIVINSRDAITSYEQALFYARHSISRLLKSLPKKPYQLDEGLDKSKWDGYYLSYSSSREVHGTFDGHYDNAAADQYFPEDFRETLRGLGFNITKYPRRA